MGDIMCYGYYYQQRETTGERSLKTSGAIHNNETVNVLVFEPTGSSEYSEFSNQTERLSIIYTGLLSWMRKKIHFMALSSNLLNHANFAIHLVAFFELLLKRSQRKVDFLRDLSHLVFVVVTNPSTFIITRLSISLQNLSQWACALVPCWCQQTEVATSAIVVASGAT